MEKSNLVEIVLAARQRQKSSPTAAAAQCGGPVSPTALTDLCNRIYPQAARRAGSLKYGSVNFVGNTRNPTGVVLLCHGLGDTNEGWSAGVEDLSDSCPHVLFVLPTAPTQPVALNMNMPCTAWYDIKGLGPRSEEDPTGVAISVGYLHKLVSDVLADKGGLPWSRVVCSGFSQGGAVTLALALLAPQQPAGAACLSGYLAAREYVMPNMVNKNIPIFQAHGTADPMVRVDVAEASKKMLQESGVTNIDTKMYRNMAHSTCPQEMRDYAAFINKVLPK